MSKTALLVFSVAFVFSGAVLASERATASGKVVDADGHPVEHAAVLVYSAGVKTGYNQFCPTCYVDCGKRAFTDADGTFAIAGLAPDLVFNLLIVDDGYAAKFVRKVDPAKGPAETATLEKRPPVANPAQIVRGRVVDQHGAPLHDAVVEQQGAIFQDGGQSFGDGGWIELLSVTNQRGEFTLAYEKPLKGAVVQVTARGMATKLARIPAGSDSATITVTEGATIRGRLLTPTGKPVANAEVGLSGRSHGAAEVLPEFRIGTDAEGNFTITNVPAGRVWDVYGKMESLAPLGLASEVNQCATKDDGQDVNAGELQTRTAYTLRGRVVLNDGKPIPPGMRVSLGIDQLPDLQTIMLPPDGSFEFKGVGRGVYDIGPSVKGYEPVDRPRTQLLIEGDQNNLDVPLQPRQ
jgi:uncharacterized GH25 family protein